MNETRDQEMWGSEGESGMGVTLTEELGGGYSSRCCDVR